MTLRLNVSVDKARAMKKKIEWIIKTQLKEFEEVTGLECDSVYIKRDTLSTLNGESESTIQKIDLTVNV